MRRRINSPILTFIFEVTTTNRRKHPTETKKIKDRTTAVLVLYYSLFVFFTHLGAALPVGSFHSSKGPVAAPEQRAAPVIAGHDDYGVLQPPFLVEMVHKPPDRLVQKHQYLYVQQSVPQKKTQMSVGTIPFIFL